MKTGKVWFVTGASQGLGLNLVKELLNAGYRVAATSRNALKLKNAVGVIDSEDFCHWFLTLGIPIVYTNL